MSGIAHNIPVPLSDVSLGSHLPLVDLDFLIGRLPPAPLLNSSQTASLEQQRANNNAKFLFDLGSESGLANVRGLTRTSEADLDRSVQYTATEILSIRNALKLNAKFLRGIDQRWGPEQLVPLHDNASEVGMLLAVAGAKAEQVIAGIFYISFHVASPESKVAFEKVVDNKFGSEISRLLKSALGNNVSEAIDQNPDVAPLLCAAVIADCSTGIREYSPAIIKDFQDKFQEAGVPKILLDQLTIEIAGKISPNKANEDPQGWLDAVAVVQIRNAMRFAALLFKDQSRKWGPKEKLPLTIHTAEVGLILALCHAEKDLIVAGILHDIFEKYTDHNPQQLRERALRNFGKEAVRLIDAVTEPEKTPELCNWSARKLALLMQVQRSDLDAANLSCATKISTIAAGNKTLYMGRPITEWSAGNLEDNLAVFEIQRQQFAAKGVKPALLTQFDIELQRMASWIGKDK